jgi:hypothetical protein
MYNWNTNTSNWDKNSDSYNIWQLEQLINFGLGDKKLDLKLTKKYWRQLQLDQYRRRFLNLILWPKQS